jgi:hypothetical protein
MNKATELHKIFLDCLFKDGEIPTDGSIPKDAVLVDGIVTNIGFEPNRLKANKPKILELAKSIVTDPFMKGTGDGMSFLQLCEDREGNQWGEHRNMEQLVLLCKGLGMADYCLPKEFWGSLPGGVPYVCFDLTK